MEKRRIKEGKTEIIVPKEEKISKEMPVFFNEDKELDRTLSVLFIKSFYDKKLRICDLLAGTGARGLRIMNETSNVKEDCFNDANPRAVELIKQNLKNSGLNSRSEVFNKEAREFIYSVHEPFDYIDIDPYGSPVPFFRAAFSRLSFHKGVVSITATDVATLMGTYPKTCLRRYNTNIRKVPCSRELGLRVLIKKAIEIGAQDDLALKPLFSHYYRHYYRTYLLLEKEGAQPSDEKMDQLGYLQHCPNCLYRGKYELGDKRECPVCGKPTQVIGPIWLGPLSKRSLVKEMLKTKHLKILGRIYREAEVKRPFYYHLPSIAKNLGKSTPPIKKAIEELNAVRTHFDPEAIKTEKNIEEVKEIF